MKNTNKTKTMVLGALLSAIVFVMQFVFASLMRAGIFSFSLVLVPIVIGAATCGALMGAWLGLVFGIAVLASGDAAAFLAVNVLGTIITVILKGVLCGYFAGLTYRLSVKLGKTVAVILSAIICPLVNTGVFLLGCLAFFMDTITEWAGPGGNIAYFMVFGLVGVNFLFELLSNIVLSPIIVRLLNASRAK